MAVDAHGMPVRFFLTKGTTSDFKKAIDLIKNIKAKHLLADRGYDSQAILDMCKVQEIQAEIPPKRNRRWQRFYDKHLYKHRHLIENAFLHLKRWRSVATRYAKNIKSFLAIIQIRCIDMWLK